MKDPGTTIGQTTFEQVVEMLITEAVCNFG